MTKSSDYDSIKDIKKDRQGDWLVTYTGKKFYPFDPREEEIDPVDIAHALSNMCRFGGHSLGFYSVAQHCVLVSQLCAPENALVGLLHDASEAYLADMPSPLKRNSIFDGYREVENKVMSVILTSFGLKPTIPDEVHLVDRRILATEARDLTLGGGLGWSGMPDPYDMHIKPWSQEYAKTKYFSRLHELTRVKTTG